MRNITKIMDHYRIVARSVWNEGFWSAEGLQNHDSWDRFQKIKESLFNALVVAQVSEVSCCEDDLANRRLPVYQVVPVEELSPVPIMIQKPREGTLNVYWDDPVKDIKPSDASLQFIDYFDWNNMGYVDFRYYRVRIITFAAFPHLIGREALLEYGYATVLIP